MQNLSILSQVGLYVLLGTMGLYCLLVFGWQIMVLKGKAMRNADGSFDDWHEQRAFYGIAFADVVLSCPLNIVGIILVFLAPSVVSYTDRILRRDERGQLLGALVKA